VAASAPACLRRRRQEHHGTVDIELLVVADCPNESRALLALGSAFAQVGLGAQPVRVTVITNQNQAEERGFVGSPTILIDGVDPFAVPGQSPAVACRVYATPAGLAGVPPLDDVVAALTASRDRGSAQPE
jgi:hypothetical protein